MRKDSVLNIDGFDRRRFQEIFQMSNGLKTLNQTGEDVLPTFSNLMRDTWASLYKMNPQLKDEVSPNWLVNHALMKNIMADDSFQGFRDFTRLDDLSAALGTVKFGEKTYDWLKEQKEQNESLRRHLEEARQQQDDLKKQKKPQSKTDKGQDQKNGLEQMQEKMQRALQQVGKEIEKNPEGLKQALAEAVQETKDAKNELKSLLTGMNAGNGEAELKKIPLRDQITLAEKLSTHDKLKDIAQWAGRFKQIARKKQKSKHTESVERSGVGIGNQVERLLPIELGQYMKPSTKLDFLKRFTEGQTMQFEKQGKERLGKGPIVLCLDQSGSMRDLDTQAKGFALAMMSIARKQRRDFALILFSTTTRTFKYAKGKITSKDMVELATTFLGGGTRFDKPLSSALQVIEENRFKKADIVFITDGRANLRQDFIATFQQKKKQKDFNVLSVLLKMQNEQRVRPFSDEIVQVEDFTNEAATAAFQI
ncbi:MAG TPA: VWA domain-containing protein [Bacillales bacterium]